MPNVGSLIVSCSRARPVRKGEELEHYHPESAQTPRGGSHHGASGQLAPKMA
jgi:hypothetical protein